MVARTGSLLWLCLGVVLATRADASVPQTITYEGYLSDLADRPIEGNFAMGFALYSAAQGGEALWQRVLLTEWGGMNDVR